MSGDEPLQISARPSTEADISLWSDPRWARAREAMGDDQVKLYASIGSAFNSIDYTNGSSAQIPIPLPDEECLAHIEAGARSGLLVKDLSSAEVALLKAHYGSEWEARSAFGAGSSLEKDEREEPPMNKDAEEDPL